jgi:hypothetical protein
MTTNYAESNLLSTEGSARGLLCYAPWKGYNHKLFRRSRGPGKRIHLRTQESATKTTEPTNLRFVAILFFRVVRVFCGCLLVVFTLGLVRKAKISTR